MDGSLDEPIAVFGVDLPEPIAPPTKLSKEEREQELIDYILEHFIENGEGCTVEILAARLGVSKSTVHRDIRNTEGRGLFWRSEQWKQTYSRDYAMFEAGAVKFYVYRPSDAALRGEIRRLRTRITGSPSYAPKVTS
jgi:IS30 family transposase